MEQFPDTSYPVQQRSEFIGRVQEQRQFLVVLGGLLLHHQVWFESAAEFGVDFDPDRAPGDDTYANIFLVHGIGGIGKSWLTRRCLDLAEGMPIDLPDNLPILTLYEDVSHGAPVLEPVHLLDRLRDHLDQAGYRVHLAGYRQAQAELPGLVDRVMRYQFEHRELWDDSLRIAAELVARSNPEAGHRSYADISLAFSHVSGAEATGKDASTLARAYDLLLERMESEQILDTTEVALFRNPPAAQAAQLADALKHISRLRPLVIGLDNLELIVSLEPLIRDCLVLPTNHAPIIWLLSSRYNLADERLVEINAEQRIYKGYRDLLGENPPVVWDMSIFGDADLRDYLQAESERRRISLVVDDPLVEAVKSTSSGVPLVVEMVADALFTMDRDDFLRDFALDDKSLLPGDRLDRITSRFLRYCLTQAEDLARVQAMALLRKGSDAPALAAVWSLSGSQAVPEVFAGLRARYAFVLPEGLHDAVYEFVRRQLRTTRQANETRDRLSRRAVNHYRAEWQALHDHFDDPTLRVRDPNWQRSTRDLVNALLWHSPDEAVTFLLPRFVEGLGFDRPFSNGLLIQAEEFLTGSIATFSRSYANLLHRMRMGLQDIEWVFDEPGEAIGAMVDMLLEAPNLDPLHLSILYLWQGNWLAENGHYKAALTAYFEADQHRSAAAAGLGRQLARAFYELSSRFLWPESAAETVPSEPGLQAAQRAVELDPGHGAAWFNLGVALDYLGQLEKSVPAYERAIEIEPRPVHYNNLGDVYSALGREDEAESAFESALELEPTYAWPYHSLGQMFAERGDYDSALDYYQQAIDHHQRDKDRAISWDGFGDAQSALGNYDEAISAYRWAGVLFPTYAPSWHGLGNAYRALQRDSDAIEAYQKAISLDPNHAWSYHNLGLIFTQQDDFSSAIHQYQQALDRHADDPARAAAWVGLGDAYSAAERHRDAIEAYQQALKLDSDQAFACNGLGDVYQVLGRSSDAVEAYRQAVELNPDFVSPWNSLAGLYTAQERYESAISAYEQVVRLEPDYAWPYNNLGFIYAKQREFDQALDYYHQAIERHQAEASKAVSWSNSGDVYVVLGNHDEAIEAYRSATDLAPDYAWPYHNLAMVYEARGDQERAIALYQQAIERHERAEDRAVSWHRLADVQRKLERTEPAIEAYQEVLTLQPENAEAWNSLGDVYQAAADDLEATKAYQQAIELDPDFGWPFHNLGLIASQRGDHESALTRYQAAIERHPDNRAKAISWNKLGDTYRALGNSAEASAAYRRAISLAPAYAWPYHNLAAVHEARAEHQAASSLYHQAIERHSQDTDRARSWSGLGNVSRALERFEEAIEAYRQAVELDSTYATPWTHLGNVFRSQARHDEAISAYKHAVELDPANPGPYFNLGLVYEALDEYESALLHFEQAFERYGDDQQRDKAVAWYHRGYVYRGLEQYEAAIDACQKAIEFDPEYAAAWQAIGDTYTALERDDEAIEAYERAVELDPAGPVPWNSLGNVNRARKNYQAAIEAYQRAIELDPAYAWPYHNLGSIDNVLEKYNSAANHFLQAIERHKPAEDRAVSWHALGNVYRAQAHAEQALEAYQRAIGLDPRYAQSYHGLGLIYSKLGRYEAAVDQYQLSLDRQTSETERARVWKDLGDAYSFLRLWEEAANALRQAMALDPEYGLPWLSMGNLHRSTGRNDEAIEAYEKAIALDPAEAWSYNNLGLIYERLGQYEQALELYQQALERHSTNSDKAVSCNNLGDVYYARQEFSDAVEAYQQAIFLDPNYARPWNGVGDAYRAHGTEKGVADAYQRAIELDPGFGWPYHNLGLLSYDSGAYVQAMTYYQQALERHLRPEDQAVSWNALGNVYRALDRNEQATDAYKKAIGANPADAWPYHNLGFVYKNLELYHLAITSYQQAIERHANDRHQAVTWNNLGNVYTVLDRYDDAIKAYQQAADLNAEYALPWNSLGEIYSRLDRAEEAIEAFQKAIERDSDYSLAWNNLGDVYRQSGLFDESIRAYEQAIRLDSRYAWPYHNLGLVHEERGDFEAATTYYQEAINRHEDSEQKAVLWDNLGSIYRLAGEDQPAIEAYHRAAGLDPDYASPWYSLGNVYAALELDDEAIGAFRRAIDLGPDDPWPYHNMGLVYEKQERFGQAIVLYQQAIERHSNDRDRAVSWDSLGTVYCDAGRYEEATDAFSEAIRLNPDYAHPWNSLGDVYTIMDDQQQAADAYRRAIELDPDYARPYNNLGLVYENLGEYEQAISIYRDVIGRHTNDQDRAISWNSLGDVYSTLRREDEAITAYEQAIRLNPDYTWPYNSLGAIYEKRGDRDQAYALYQQATRRHRQRAVV